MRDTLALVTGAFLLATFLTALFGGIPSVKTVVACPDGFAPLSGELCLRGVLPTIHVTPHRQCLHRSDLAPGTTRHINQPNPEGPALLIASIVLGVASCVLAAVTWVVHRRCPVADDVAAGFEKLEEA